MNCVARVKLSDVALVLRSKNAGPYIVTIDVILPSSECLHEVATVLTKELVARAYNIGIDDVLSVHVYEPSLAIKVNIRRRVPAGSIGDTDVYGAQQHIPLALLTLDLEKCVPRVNA